MLTNALDNMKRSRAAFAKDVEYMKEMANDDIEDDILMSTESLYLNESAVDNAEIEAIMQEITAEDDFSEKEIERILESTDDTMTFEEMVGIEYEPE